MKYLTILTILLALLTAACQMQEKEHSETVTEYTCPMHPQIVQTEAGTCPICKMDLVPRAGHGGEEKIAAELAFLLKPTNSSVISGINTVKPQQKTVQATVQMDGIITYDPRRVFTIPARVAGRIEKLYMKFNFQPVRKGQKLMEIYSPDLITAQKELLYLVKAAPDDKQLIEAAKQRLRLLGASEAQLRTLIRSGNESYTFALYSPYDGYIINLNTTAPGATVSQAAAAGSTMDAMGSSAAATGSPQAPAPVAPALELREGMYVSAGQALLQVVNPEQLWAEFTIPAGEVNHIAKGTPVQITFPQLPGEKLKGKADFFQPFYQEGESFAKMRVYLPGKQEAVMVGQLVSAEATYTTPSGLWVPQAAVLDIGTQTIVFRKTGQVFEPKAVTTGTTTGGQVQVLTGLEAQDVIATNAQFLVDSENFIKVNN